MLDKYESLIEEYESHNTINEQNIDEKKQEALNSIYNSEWFLNKPENIKQKIKEYPLFGFYKIKSANKPIRIIGIEESKNGELKVATCVPMFGMDILNRTIGGHNFDNIVKIDKWSKEDLDDIRLYSLCNPLFNYIFRHPFGVLLLLDK